MASIVFYFQVHQPWRLRRYSVFDADRHYFDDAANKQTLLKVADNCYRPASRLLLDMIRAHDGGFRIAFSLTGTVLEQLEQWAPDVIDTFRRLAETGCCEFLGETDRHSLSFLYSRDEFQTQVEQHTARIEAMFGQTPRVFRNTELTYNNDVAHVVNNMTTADGSKRFTGMLCEGIDRLLGGRSPNHVYQPPTTGDGPTPGGPFALLLKDVRLADDIAFRFGTRGSSGWPLMADTFAQWVRQVTGDGELCNLFLDFETFGEHQRAETGILEFLADIPRAVFAADSTRNRFITPSEAFDEHTPVGTYDVPEMISWADSQRDLSAWLGNSMQNNAMAALFKLEPPLKAKQNEAKDAGDATTAEQLAEMLEDWRRLTTSDHFYYMGTKYFADGAAHRYFSPYDSPYDSYVNFMNVLDNLRTRLSGVSVKS